MLPASHPLLYACVFRDQELVAELLPDAPPDPSLPSLAAALVAGAPPHHRYVTYTAAGRAHALLLAPPLALLAVSLSPPLPASHLLLFLRRLRCVSHFALPREMLRLALQLPFLDDAAALAREAAEVAAAERATEEAEEEARWRELTPRRPKRGEAAAGGRGWRWRPQLWVVLLVDLVLLCVFFAVWLAVCKGFSCIGR